MLISDLILQKQITMNNGQPSCRVSNDCPNSRDAGTVRKPYRSFSLYPDRCLGFTEFSLINLLVQRFPGCTIRRLSSSTRSTQREGNSMCGLWRQDPKMTMVLRGTQCFTSTDDGTEDLWPNARSPSTELSLHPTIWGGDATVSLLDRIL